MRAIQSISHAWLLLENGLLFRGKSYGAQGTTGGELCFNTGMTGYGEIFTDPSYTGQVLVMNNAYTGNYGIKYTETESDSVKVKGLVCKNIAHHHSRPLADEGLESYLVKNNVIAIYDIDTRALVQQIRSKGAMNCIISTEISDEAALRTELEKVPCMAGQELSSRVSAKEPYTIGDNNAPLRVAVLDFGAKRNILQCLAERNIYVKVFPAKTSLAAMEEFNPHGYFASNGPGDPASMDYAVQTIKDILRTGNPFFGICLGHQLLALANGIPTYKMHHGHRGMNHPVKNLMTGKCEITTQNHGFGVDTQAIKNCEHVEITHLNLNDDSVEGIRVKGKPAFSVQYHPEAAPGPHDSRYLFDDFIKMIVESKHN